MKLVSIFICSIGVILSSIMVAEGLYSHESVSYLCGWISSTGWALSALVSKL